MPWFHHVNRRARGPHRATSTSTSPGVEQPCERVALGLGHVGRPDEGVRVEHVAVGRGDVDVAGDDDVGVVDAATAGSGRRVRRGTPACTRSASGRRSGRAGRTPTPPASASGSRTTQVADSWLTIEVLVVELARRPRRRRSGAARSPRRRCTSPPPTWADVVAVLLEHRGRGVRQARGLRLLQADDVGADPLEEPLDGREPTSERVQVPGRDPEPVRRRPRGRQRGPQRERGVPPFEPRRTLRSRHRLPFRHPVGLTQRRAGAPCSRTARAVAARRRPAR